VVNSYVFVGSSSGNLYALDATTGTQLWSQSLGAAIAASNQVQSGLSAGDGLLIVPSGNSITAYVLSTNP
jgi:outer membrane protein assembly factor BamB